ncbi:hypothetical protein [Crocosphaera chwakensis]|uniref:Uncharacterized protein n=1 Tax=Crocosphaera chwakensis CCY0110 TaxID=391612 RepID=A3IVQ6_9CHRO|nr:hypothetical protein [Crocosphaera chwakensis]EAZ89446.1 hypothetical protein CY0110_27099 [Crocosphaera chwakensis CCY0110]
MNDNQNNQSSEKSKEQATAKLQSHDTTEGKGDETIKFFIEDTISINIKASSGEEYVEFNDK